jgi:hypothetical protein
MLTAISSDYTTSGILGVIIGLSGTVIYYSVAKLYGSEEALP